MKYNPYRHYYLYAKNHYKQSNNVVEDLKKIQADYCGVAGEHLRVSDIIHVLLKIVWKHINYENGFFDFIEAISPYSPNYRFLGSKEYEFTDALIHKCLLILQFTEVSNIEGELGKPSPKILPLKGKV